jgi:hypothetical protein
MPDKLSLLIAIGVCVCLALYAIERTLMEILKVLRDIRLRTTINAAWFLKDAPSPGEVAEDSPKESTKLN